MHCTLPTYSSLPHPPHNSSPTAQSSHRPPAAFSDYNTNAMHISQLPIHSHSYTKNQPHSPPNDVSSLRDHENKPPATPPDSHVFYPMQCSLPPEHILQDAQMSPGRQTWSLLVSVSSRLDCCMSASSSPSIQHAGFDLRLLLMLVSYYASRMPAVTRV